MSCSAAQATRYRGALGLCERQDRWQIWRPEAVLLAVRVEKSSLLVVTANEVTSTCMAHSYALYRQSSWRNHNDLVEVSASGRQEAPTRVGGVRRRGDGR